MLIKSNEIKIVDIDSINSDIKYKVTSEGKIIGPRGEIKPRMGGYKKQYQRFSARINGKNKDFYIHRIILTEFVRPPKIGEQACHNDGNPRNNNLENLRWDTPKNNSRDKIKHGTSGVGQKNAMAKIKDCDALFIATTYQIIESSVLSEYFKISRASVIGISSGKIRYDKELENVYKINKLVAKKRMSANNRISK